MGYNHAFGKLVYASAVPINKYVNGIGVVSPDFGDEDMRTFQSRIAESVLVAQYYGAMKASAAHRTGSSKVKVFLMPLGGGVFNNSTASIVRAISIATELLDLAERDALTLKVLAFNRARRDENGLSECDKYIDELRKH